MDKIITYNFNENFISRLSDFIIEEFSNNNHDFSRILCVFGGKRPGLFLRRELSKRIKKCFIPPQIFTMPELVNYIIISDKSFPDIDNLELCFLIYNMARKIIPDFVKGRDSFASFLPWAREIVSFIDQLDQEDIDNNNLLHIEKSASIGYEIPPNINRLLEYIISLRIAYNNALREKGIYSLGMKYLKASEMVINTDFKEFDSILFCNFFYLHKTEQKIIKSVHNTGKGYCLFQGSEDEWSVLKDTSLKLGCKIKSYKIDKDNIDFSLYQGFDIHSQVCLVHKILNDKIKNKDNTVILVPQPEALIPLLAEISSSEDDLNVSMGYPFKRTSIFSLCEFLHKAQESKKDGKYYAKDYLNLVMHPFVKNCNLGIDLVIIRVIAHKIEDVLKGKEDSTIGGSLFASLSEIEDEKKIYQLVCNTLKNINIDITLEECTNYVKEIHRLFFIVWEDLVDFYSLAQSLSLMINILSKQPMVLKSPLNIKAIDKLYGRIDVFRCYSFKNEKFNSSDIWDIFIKILERDKISFIGSPLQGIQVLGPLETRSLNFENVIIMDMNEGVMPKLKILEPLIPREVMLNLGLNRLEKSEEIQRYQFRRLIDSAKNIYFIYEENQEKEKSRFIEELLWDKQKRLKKINVVSMPKASFSFKVITEYLNIRKTVDMVEFLKKSKYSATRISTYLRCSLKFYYQYVLGFKESEDLLEEPNASHIGTFIHELLEDTFQRFIGKKPNIDKNFEKYFFKVMDEKFGKILARRMRSDAFLLKKIMVQRLEKFLINERIRNVTKLICLEDRADGIMKLTDKEVKFIYTVDRIDQFGAKSIRVLDYKTGGSNISPKNLKSLLKMEMNIPSIKENIRSFQLPIYYYFISQNYPECDVNAELYNIRSLKRTPFIFDGDFSQKEEVMAICMDALDLVFSELFDINISFKPIKQDRQCEVCPFVLLCR